MSDCLVHSASDALLGLNGSSLLGISNERYSYHSQEKHCSLLLSLEHSCPIHSLWAVPPNQGLQDCCACSACSSQSWTCTACGICRLFMQCKFWTGWSRCHLQDSPRTAGVGCHLQCGLARVATACMVAAGLAGLNM